MIRADRRSGNSSFALCLTLLAFTGTCVAQEAKPQTVTLSGQLVCSVCWFEADRKTAAFGTPEDITCARDCADKGIPSAVAVKQGDDYKLYLIELEQLKKDRAEWVNGFGRQVEIIGRVSSKQGKDYVSLDSFKFLPASLSSTTQQPSSLGTEVELSLKDLSGIDQRLSASRGRVVVLNFWATWCVPCRKEMPDLAAIQNEYAAFGVQVVGASADQLADRDKVIQFIKQSKVNFPVWLGANTEDMRRFGVGPGLPATVIIGRDGKIAALYPGVIKQAELKKELDRLLGAGAVAIAREKPAAKTGPQDVSLVPS